MKPKTVILMGVAIVCGLIAAALVSMATQAKPGPEMVNVLVAAEELRQGKVLDKVDQQFVPTPMPRESIPVNALTDKKQLEGMQVLRTLDKGMVPTVGSVGKYEGLDKQLPKDHRAMTIRVTMDSAVAGFILPGAKVDLMCSVPTRDGRSRVSKIFMQKMLVLAVNTADVRDEKSRVMGNPSTVTLAVTPKQAEQLNLVTGMSDVRMVLRKPDDETVYKGKGARDPLDSSAQGDEPEADQDVWVAKADITPDTEVTDEKFDELFETKKFPKVAVPANAVMDRKDILAAKGVYSMLGKGAVVCKYHLAKVEKTAGGTETAPVVQNDVKPHELTIYNGQQPVIKVAYDRRGRGTGSMEGQVGVPPPGPATPGSEGK